METKGQSSRPQFITGDFRHNVDAKGRITIPSRWRVGIGTDVFISPNPDGALVVMSEDEFKAVQEQANASDASEEEKSRFRRYLASKTHVTQMDRQGRINLNENLMNLGQISPEDEVMLIGKISRFEVYNLERWERVAQTLPAPFETISRKIGF